MAGAAVRNDAHKTFRIKSLHSVAIGGGRTRTESGVVAPPCAGLDCGPCYSDWSKSACSEFESVSMKSLWAHVKPLGLLAVITILYRWKILLTNQFTLL